eukprot:6510195-Prymnesium_polylepis.1
MALLLSGVRGLRRSSRHQQRAPAGGPPQHVAAARATPLWRPSYAPLAVVRGPSWMTCTRSGQRQWYSRRSF